MRTAQPCSMRLRCCSTTLQAPRAHADPLRPRQTNQNQRRPPAEKLCSSLREGALHCRYRRFHALLCLSDGRQRAYKADEGVALNKKPGKVSMLALLHETLTLEHKPMLGLPQGSCGALFWGACHWYDRACQIEEV